MTEHTITEVLKMAVQAHKSGDVETADKLHGYSKAQPNHSDANRNMGVLAIEVGKRELIFSKAINANPKVEQFWVSLIDNLTHLKRMDEARKIAQKAIKNGINNQKIFKITQAIQERSKVKINAEIVQKLYEKYDARDYVSLLNIANEYDREYLPPEIINLVAGSYIQLDNLNEAVMELEKANYHYPFDHTIFYNLGIAYKNKKKFKKAINAFEKALS